MIEIDKNIPVPARRDGGRLYPWVEMEIGDSFIFKKASPHSTAKIASTRYAPRKFMARKDGDAFRIWRVA